MHIIGTVPNIMQYKRKTLCWVNPSCLKLSALKYTVVLSVRDTEDFTSKAIVKTTRMAMSALLLNTALESLLLSSCLLVFSSFLYHFTEL